MIGQKPPTGSIFLTASQSMQGFQTDMRLVEQAKREASQTDIADDLDGKTLQQAPSADQQRNRQASQG